MSSFVPVGAVVDAEVFTAFVREVEPTLRRALVAKYGAERGREATAEALAYAWDRRDHVLAMANPVGYLVRVGQSRTRGLVPRKITWLPPRHDEEGAFEPKLAAALAGLSARQRQAVVLCAGYGMSLAEAAEVLGTSRSSVHTNLRRGLAAVRLDLGAVELEGPGDERGGDNGGR